MSETEPIPPTSSVTALRIPIIKRSLWKAIKARFGGNEASKKMQKNLLKQQFETFTIGSREELDSAYERFQHILSMLELHDATVSIEDANLKFLRSLPSVWHVVATMIRGTTGLDGQYFDNNMKIICSFFAQQASMPTTHDDEDLLQIDEDAMEEIDIRWQVAMITARIRKFMRKTGRPIDLKPKNGITFDKSKIECFNCSKDWTGVDQDDWSMELMRSCCILGKMDLVILTGAKQSCGCTKYSLSFDGLQTQRTEILGYQMSLESLEIRDLKLEEKQKELDQVLKERDDFKVKLEKWSNASVLQNEVLNKQRYVSDKSCIGFGIESSNSMESDISSGDETLTDSTYENFKREKAYKAVPPPTGTIIPPRANVSFTGIDELAIRNKVVNQEKTKSSQSAIDRNKVIIEDWVDSDVKENYLEYTSVLSRSTGRTLLSKDGYRRPLESQGDKDNLSDFKEFKGVMWPWKCSKAPRKNDVYSLDLKNIIPSGGITCLVAKATEDEAVTRQERLACQLQININKLVKGNLVRGLPSNTFKLDHSCVACRKGKQHRASCKKIEERTVREPLELLHMDLFGPISVESINKKKYCLVVTDDCSKFSWVFFLAYKDETYDMLHDLIVGLENRLRHKVEGTIRVVLVINLKMKTPFDNLDGKISYHQFHETFWMASLTILNIWIFGKFDGKSEEGYLLDSLTNSKGF
ncbi:putative ribonuclease H-like domain-containing protein [Tanacetum coccineum]